MIKTIIIDDDLYHIESLSKMLIEYHKQVEIIATCSNVPEGVSIINLLKPQLIFLDIEMGNYTGFDLLEMVDEQDFDVIFITAYQEYAIQAIKASALDYIEKPIDLFQLEQAMQRYNAKTGKERMRNLLANFRLNDEHQKIALYDDGGLCFFEVKEIVRCQSDNAYTEFFISDGNKKNELIRIEASKGLAHFEDFLVTKGFFFRVHNQHLINIDHIRKYVKDKGGYLIMDDISGKIIPIARARKDDFLHFLKLKGILL